MSSSEDSWFDDDEPAKVKTEEKAGREIKEVKEVEEVKEAMEGGTKTEETVVPKESRA